MLTRLLAALALACSALVALGAPSTAACPADRSDLQERTMRADDVFTGVVSGASSEGTTVVYTVDVDQIYKGEVDEQASLVTDARKGGCGLPALEDGGTYVFFVEADGSRLVIDSRGGTAPASDEYVAQVEDLLGQGRPAVPPAPVEATFTRVADAPSDVQRIAAPGVALVIVGVLGLVFVAWRGRRRA